MANDDDHHEDPDEILSGIQTQESAAAQEATIAAAQGALQIQKPEADPPAQEAAIAAAQGIASQEQPPQLYVPPDVPPPLPVGLQHLIQEQPVNYSRPFEKKLTDIDVRCMLFIRRRLVNDLLEPMFTVHENQMLLGNGMEVTTYDSDGKDYPMKIKLGHSHFFTGGEGWRSFSAHHGLEGNRDVVTLWMFRDAETKSLCFLITIRRLQHNDDHHEDEEPDEEGKILMEGGENLYQFHNYAPQPQEAQEAIVVAAPPQGINAAQEAQEQPQQQQQVVFPIGLQHLIHEEQCSPSFQKQLSSADARPEALRLVIRKRHVEEHLEPMLNANEDLSQGIPVTIYDSEGNQYPLEFKIWGKSGTHHVLGGRAWRQFLQHHALVNQRNTVLNLWTFRNAQTQNLCFLITNGGLAAP